MSDAKAILVVDDDDSVRRMLVSLFVPRGWIVHEASRLDEARRVLALSPVQLILIDGLLPDGNGMDLIAEIREDESCPRIALMSALFRDQHTARRLSEELRVAAVIHKPFKPAEVLVQVEELLTERATTMQEEASKREAEGTASAELAALREDYRLRLDGRLDALGDAMRDAREHPDNAAGLAMALRMAHQLHGSAGTYGFMAVSHCAGQIEEQLTSLVASSQAAGQDVWQSGFEALAQARSAVPPLKEPTEGETPQGEGDVHTATVLLLDSDPGFLHRMERVGREELLRVIPVGTAEEALIAAQRETRLDGAVIDLALPGTEGPFRVAARLRALRRHGELPIAFLSADGTIPKRLAATHADADLFLTKPLTAFDFVQAGTYLAGLRRPKNAKVLILEDDLQLAEHLAKLLESHGLKVAILDDPSRILDVLPRERPDLVLTDVVMPEVSGFEVCRLLRSTPEWRELPILLMTARVGLDVRVAAFEAGADDYIPKPIAPQELLARVRPRLERIRRAQERAQRDPVTTLLVRTAFTSQLSTRLAEIRRQGARMALCLLDLDHFKRVNDEHGHLAGDRVLATLGRTLSYRLRDGDLRGRWGGEEFVLAFFGEPASRAKTMLQRILDEFRAVSFVDDHGAVFRVTFSAGIASLPEHGTSLEDLVRAADELLYKAKEGGRARIET